MNTRIEYLYRDASNYKKSNQVIVAGVLSEAQKQTIQECLSGGEYFIPRQVGFPEIRFEEITEDDHCWFELSTENFYETTQNVTVKMTADEVVNAFLSAKDNWQDTMEI